MSSQLVTGPAAAVLAAGKRFELHPTGLKIQPGIKLDEWEKIGGQVVGLHSATSWALGDWLFYGEWEYGSSYEAAAAATGLAVQTLTDLKHVAGRFEFSRRRENLSLSHHREVAPLPLDEQDDWLDQAEEGGWSREQLRNAIAGRPVSARPVQLEPALPAAADAIVHADLEQLVIVVESDRAATWRDKATTAGLTVEEWVRSTCDGA